MNPEIMNLVSSFLGNAGGGHSRRGLAPWAIRAEEVISSLQMVRNVRGAAPHAGAASMAATLSSETLAPGSFARRVGNTAIVPVYGPLVARFSYGYFSYEEIIRDLRLAAGTAGITRILMEIDSPGGIGFMIDSVPAVIAEITQTIPVDGHIRGIGASAAYWIASAGGRVTADRTSLVGSVGALIHYVDLEGILTKLGGTVIEAIAQQSPNKRLPHESDAGKAELQAIVDDAGQMFVEALARHRGVAVENDPRNLRPRPGVRSAGGPFTRHDRRHHAVRTGSGGDGRPARCRSAGPGPCRRVNPCPTQTGVGYDRT